MNKLGKFWLFGKQDEPAEDFDVDYDNIYYGEQPAESESVESEQDLGDGYSATYGAESDVKVVKEEEPVEEAVEEPLYRVVFEPETYQDSAEIVECLKMGRVVVIDTVSLGRDDFLRMLDYVMGALQALDGQMVRITKDVVALFPADVDTEIDINEIEDEPVDYEEDGEEPSEE